MSRRLIADLERTVAGPVIPAGDPRLEAEAATMNATVRHRPEAVVGATSAADVAAAVRVAAAEGLPLAVQSTGHGALDGLAGGILITTRRMNRVEVDAHSRTARVGAGTRFSDLLPTAAAHGLATLNGSSSGVGIAGYCAGGGLPLLGRTFGFAADHVRWVEMVTAAGEAVRVTAESDPDLFWALRGGGGGFGIVTGLEIGLVPVRTVFGGSVFFPGERARDLLGAWAEWTAGLPETMTSSMDLLRLPDLPGVPPPLAGRLTLALRVTFAGPAAAGERLVAPMLGVAPALIDGLAEIPYTSCDSIFQDPTEPVPVWHRGMVLSGLDAAALDALAAEACGAGPSEVVFVDIRHLGGALGREPEIPNAVGVRKASYGLMAAGMVGAEGREPVAAAVGSLMDALAPWRAEGAIPNLLGHTSSPSDMESALGAHVAPRLVEVKRRVDPGNLFCFGPAGVLAAERATA